MSNFEGVSDNMCTINLSSLANLIIIDKLSLEE